VQKVYTQTNFAREVSSLEDYTSPRRPLRSVVLPKKVAGQSRKCGTCAHGRRRRVLGGTEKEMIHEPDEYENIFWWIVAMLCRESHLAWVNAKHHLAVPHKNWTVIYDSSLPDLGIDQRLECVVAYILEHQKGGETLVTANNDRDQALWIFAESAQQKYASKVYAA
jgi:hypothetical protein